MAGKRPPDRMSCSGRSATSNALHVGLGRVVGGDGHPPDRRDLLAQGRPLSRRAHGICGRAANSRDLSQSLDSFSIEYTFADGTKAYDVVRYIPNCYTEFATFVHGTKRAAQFSGTVHSGSCHIYKDQRCTP